MVEKFSQIKEDIITLWDNFDKKVKIIIVSAVVGTMIAILLLANWASQPDYDVLFKNLAPEDSGEIVEGLREEGVDYRLEDDGGTILVPRNHVYEMRVQLASGDLPSGGTTGFEIFDETQIGATDFQQQVNYQRALSGELTRTIRQIENVENAEVQITPQSDSIYVEDDEPAEASVMLGLSPGAELGVDKIKGIANLVASGVEDLSPQNVTIVDSTGRLLSAELEYDEDDSEFGDDGDRFELTQRVENDMRQNLAMMLSRVLGPDNFAITVNAELNFDKKDVLTKTYSPVVEDEGIVRGEQGRTERSEGGSADSEGVPGTTSNIPQYEEEDSDYQMHESEEWTRNYEVNERVENLTQAPGVIDRLSVSVMINQEMIDGDNDAIREAVEAAMGYDEDRGDNVSVSAIQFDDSIQQLFEERRQEEEAQREQIIRFIAIIIVILIIAIVFILRRQSGTTSSEESQEEAANIDYTVSDAEEEMAPTQDLSEEEEERKRILGELRGIVQDQPEEIAELVRSWLVEE